MRHRSDDADQTTYLHETQRGEKIEYRRRPCGSPVLLLESRLLRNDGTPFDGRWWPVSDLQLLDLQLAGSDIVDRFAKE